MGPPVGSFMQGRRLRGEVGSENNRNSLNAKFAKEKREVSRSKTRAEIGSGFGGEGGWLVAGFFPGLGVLPDGVGGVVQVQEQAFTAV